MSRRKDEEPTRNGALLLCLGLIIYFGFCGFFGLIAYGIAESHPLLIALGVILLPVTIAVFVLFRRLGGEVTPQGRRHAAWLDVLDLGD